MHKVKARKPDIYRKRIEGEEPLDRFIFLCFSVFVLFLPFAVTERVFWYISRPKFTFFSLITSLILVAWLTKTWRKGKLEIRRSPLDLPILFFLGAYAISTAFSIHLPTSLLGFYGRFDGMLTYLSYILLYFLTVQYFTSNERQIQLVDLMLVGGLLAALVGASQQIFFGVPRPSSFFGNSVYFAAYLVIIFFLSLGRFFTSQATTRRSFYALSSLILLAVLFMTHTRSAWLALGIGLAVFFALKEKVSLKRIFGKFWWTLPVIIVLILLLVVSVLRFTNAGIRNFFTQLRLSPESIKSGLGFRFLLWRDVLKLIRNHPLVGTGPDTFFYSYSRYVSFETLYLQTKGEIALTLNNKIISDPHNLFLQMGATIGLPAVALFLTILIVFLSTAWKQVQQANTERRILVISFISGVLALLVMIQLQPSPVDFMPFTWLLMGLAMTDARFSQLQVATRGKGSRVILAGSCILVLVVMLTFVVFPLVSDFYLNESYSGNDLQDLATCKIAIKLAPYRDFLYAHLSEIYIRLSTHSNPQRYQKEAINAARVAVSKAPVDAYNSVFLGIAYLKAAKNINPFFYLKAEKALKEAIQLYPNYPQSHFYLGKVFLETGRLTEASKEFKKALPLYPEKDEVLSLLREVSEKQGLVKGRLR